MKKKTRNETKSIFHQETLSKIKTIPFYVNSPHQENQYNKIDYIDLNTQQSLNI